MQLTTSNFSFFNLKAKWLDDLTKEVTSKKLEKMKINVAFTDEIVNKDFIDDYYSNLIIDPENSLLTRLSILGHKNEDFTKFNIPGASYDSLHKILCKYIFMDLQFFMFMKLIFKLLNYF